MRSEFTGRSICSDKEYGGTVGLPSKASKKEGRWVRGGLCAEGFVSARTGERWQMGASAGWQKREVRKEERGDGKGREDPIWGAWRVEAIHCRWELGTWKVRRDRGLPAAVPGRDRGSGC